MRAEMKSQRRRALAWHGRAAIAAVATALAASACFTVTTVNIGTKTSLERQLIGELEPLSEEELLAASVRAAGQMSLGDLGDLQRAAIAARRRQLFHRDEVDEAKQAGCPGENNRAEPVLLPCGPVDGETAARLARLIAEENEDRTAIIDWALAADSSLTSADRAEIARVYRRMLQEAARPGHWIQGDDGSWTQR